MPTTFHEMIWSNLGGKHNHYNTRNMKRLILIPTIFIAATILFLQQRGQTAESHPAQTYEYATVRFMGGGKTSFVWPDGKVEKLGDLSPGKRPDAADERMYHLTLAMNILAQRGFEPVAIPSLETHSDDIWVRRPANR
jgi:hypothetical protein